MLSRTENGPALDRASALQVRHSDVTAVHHYLGISETVLTEAQLFTINKSKRRVIRSRRALRQVARLVLPC